MTDQSNRKRQPAGVPTGGEFAANTHDEAAFGLAASAGDPFDRDWSTAEDIDDPDILPAAQRSRLASIEDVMLAEPHPVSLGDGSVALFWHERRGENERDQRPDRDARAIMDASGTISDFQVSIDHGDWVSDDEMSSRMNDQPLMASNLPDAPTISMDADGNEVHVGSRYKEGASGAEIGRAMRRDIAAAVADGTLPREFDYGIRATDIDGGSIVGCTVDIGSNWEHGRNHGLLPGQSAFDMSPQRAAKVNRAERVLEKMFEARDKKTVLSETESMHAYTWMISSR